MSSLDSQEHHISLLDLNHQFPFEIDEDLKIQLSFAETLIISCAHYEGEVYTGGTESGQVDDEEESDSDWTCTETSKTEGSDEAAAGPFEVKDYVEEAEPEEPPEDDNDFHFYFYADCNKPPAPQHSKQSVITIDGIPQINPAAKEATYCTCDKDRKGKCTCHAVVPCKCGAKKKSECKCGKLDEICICHDEPAPVCVCHKEKEVCTCFPEELPRPVCVCSEVEKPCICQKGKFPSPVCKCKYKPTYSVDSVIFEGLEWGEEHELETVASKGGEGGESTELSDREPCDCQKPEPKPRCTCIKGKKCICLEDSCICGVQHVCICDDDGQEPIARIESEDKQSVCLCEDPKECTCEAKDDGCECFPAKTICTCGDPDDCKCKKKCECMEPCICDTQQKIDECICLDKSKQAAHGLVCTCPCKDKDAKKLKKIRAGKHGYRWCHDVDPYHTYFDYAYGRHDKISYKEQEKEKFKILGLYDSKEDVCPVHGLKNPKFEKKVRKPSLDCCSSVGGITISVESLGEERDKFLVQVVSHSSKEGAKTGSKLVSIIDLNLHTLEENRIEHITKKDITKERKNYMAICESGYYNKVTRICGDRHIVKRLYHTFEKAHDFLLEGANVVLLRYFAITRYKGTVKTYTVLMNGTICESVYVCTGVSQAVVNGKQLFVVKVERHIIEPNGYVHQTLTVLTLRGYMVNHEWADNNYVMHINPLLNIVPERDEIEQHSPLRDRWREDLQLLSDYLDFKSTRSSEGARYVAENGMLTATVRDYLQAILLLKPKDVLHFTRHYFDSALSALDLPRDEYFDSCPKHVRYYYIEE
ncbi:uncharacterized protein LOC126368313 [Pectinophora gossypiella]|uniref:uncharacterized protein LOC126368313 n=1 Tax=Pectinophora gossypiella TaxID=13191 RepID=UPI00214F4206|nr:uncharacterized protein LOC126368313 [Pectinophora gossypiella]